MHRGVWARREGGRVAREWTIQQVGGLASALGYRFEALPTDEGYSYQLEPTPAAEFAAAGLHVRPVERAIVNQFGLHRALASAIEQFVGALLVRVRNMAGEPDSLLKCNAVVSVARLMDVSIDEVRLGLTSQGVLELSTKLMDAARELQFAEGELGGDIRS